MAGFFQRSFQGLFHKPNLLAQNFDRLGPSRIDEEKYLEKFLKKDIFTQINLFFALDNTCLTYFVAIKLIIRQQRNQVLPFGFSSI